MDDHCLKFFNPGRDQTAASLKSANEPSAPTNHEQAGKYAIQQFRLLGLDSCHLYEEDASWCWWCLELTRFQLYPSSKSEYTANQKLYAQK